VELRQDYNLKSLKAMQKFLDDHAAELAGIGETGTRKRFDQMITELEGLAADQSASRLAAKSATQNQHVLTRRVLMRMEAISKIAGAELPPIPELAPLAMPKGKETGERLVAVARGVYREAAKFADTFIAAGLKQDFLEQLTAATDALGGCIAIRRQREAARGAATESLVRKLASARKIVDVLHAFVKDAAENNNELLAAWKRVKRTHRPTGVKTLPEPEGTAPFDAIGGAE
jgi:hypothetical protein